MNMYPCATTSTTCVVLYDGFGRRCWFTSIDGLTVHVFNHNGRGARTNHTTHPTHRRAHRDAMNCCYSHAQPSVD